MNARSYERNPDHQHHNVSTYVFATLNERNHYCNPKRPNERNPKLHYDITLLLHYNVRNGPFASHRSPDAAHMYIG